MRILDPAPVPDVSTWCDHILPKEFQDGGCTSVVVGLYPTTVNGKWVLHPTSRSQAQAVMRSGMILQGYFWDDIILDPDRQANWVADTIVMEGLDVRWLWADQEQWWTDWVAWERRAAYIPRAAPDKISLHNQEFARQMHARLPTSGIYTNNNFVVSYAPGMNAWLPQFRSWVPHYGRQPKERTAMSWEQLRAWWLPDYEIILAAGQKPELVAGQQFTGDVCMLPGSYNWYGGRLPLDVSVFSKAFLDAIAAGSEPAPMPPVAPVAPPAFVIYTVAPARINVRAKADQGSAWMRYAVKDEELHIKSPEVLQNGYLQLTDGTWVWKEYLTQA
jgi:hypothetical protein